MINKNVAFTAIMASAVHFKECTTCKTCLYYSSHALTFAHILMYFVYHLERRIQPTIPSVQLEFLITSVTPSATRVQKGTPEIKSQDWTMLLTAMPLAADQ